MVNYLLHMDTLKNIVHCTLSIYYLYYYKTVYKAKRCKQGKVYPNYNFGQNAGPMPDKHRDGRTDPRLEVATWETLLKTEILRSKFVFRNKIFPWS